MKSSGQLRINLADSFFIIFIFSLLLCSALTVSAGTFSGNTTLYYRHANRQATNQETPESYWRWAVNPTAVLFGIPVSFNMLLSSVQSENRQDVNLFSAFASPGESSSSTGILSWFKHIGLGTCNPCYTEFTLNGIRVDGVDLELTPGAFNFAFTAGRASKAIEATDETLPVYSQTLMAASAGYGTKGETHVHLNFLHAWDDAGSVTADSTFQVTPEENYVVGIDTRYLLFDDKLRLDGEFAVSIFTRDVRSPEADLENVPQWIQDIFNPNISSSVDYAYYVKSCMNFGATSLSGSVRRVGPGFESLGSPYLRTDDFMYEVRADRRFIDRQLLLGGYFRRNEDNLLPWKEYTTVSDAYGARAGLMFRNMPYLHLNFAPYYRKSEDNPAADVRTSLLSATAGYTFHRSGLSFTSNLMFYLQKSLYENETNYYRARSYSFRQIVGFQFPLMVSAGANLLQTDFQGERSDLYIINAQGSYSPGARWMVTLGGNYSFEGDMKKTDGKITLSLPLISFCTLDLSGKYTMFRDEEEADYNEYDISCSASMSW